MQLSRQKLYRAGIWAATAPLPRQQRIAARHRLRAALDNRLVLAADALVLSRAKSGRTWLRAMLSRLYQQHYGLPENLLLDYDNFHRLKPEIPVVAMTHGHYLDQLAEHGRHGARLRGRPVIFLVRDPRDVAVSEYFQATRRASAYKREMYAIDDAQSMFDFVMTAPVGLPAICEYLNHWQQELQGWDRVLSVRYEDLRANPNDQLGALCQFLGAPFSEAEIAEAVDFADFESLKKKEKENFFDSKRLRPANADDPDSFKVRRGKVGGYRDYFSDEQIRRIDTLVAERLSPVFGYGDTF